MVHRRISHHFLPHFIVDSETAKNLAEPHKVHHHAHALSLMSLFAYLQIALVFTVALYAVKLKAPQILGEITFSADQIIALTNAKRAENGLGELTSNSLLAQAASAKAQNMLAEDYWAHNSPSGKTPWSFITAAGYKYIFAGENLARDFNNPQAVVNAWMDSPSHRSNLLDSNFKEIGVAVVSGILTGRDGILVVQQFGAGISPSFAESSGGQASTSGQPSPSPIASPKAIAQISPQPKPSPSPLAVAQEQSVNDPVSNSSSETGSLTQATVLATRQFSIAKGVSFALVAFIFVMFLLEVIITARRAKVSLRSGVLAHLILLGFILFALWYAVGGAVL